MLSFCTASIPYRGWKKADSQSDKSDIVTGQQLVRTLVIVSSCSELGRGDEKWKNINSSC